MSAVCKILGVCKAVVDDEVIEVLVVLHVLTCKRCGALFPLST